MDYFRKAKSLYSSTSKSFGTGTGETITPSSIAGLPTDTEFVLTFDRTVSGKIKRIRSHITGSNFVKDERSVDGTSDQSHTSPTVEYIPNAEDINDQVDGILVEHDQDVTHDATLIAKLAGNQTITGVKTFGSGKIVVTNLTVGGQTVTPPSATDTLVGKATTDTLTNKRITRRVTTITSHATPTVNSDNCDCVTITALAEAITSMTTNLSGTPTNFQTLIYRIKDDGTARAITWGASFEAKGVTLPTTTTLSKVLTVGFIYDTVTSKFGCVAS